MSSDNKVAENNATADTAQLWVAASDGLRFVFCGTALRLPNRKARAALAYLALNRDHEVVRERLAELLWSESSSLQARNSLRQALFELNEAFKAVGYDGLRADRDRIALTTGRFHTDVSDAFRALDAAQLPILPRGGFDRLLVGYEDVSSAFNDWLTNKRHVLQSRLMQRLELHFLDSGKPLFSRRPWAEFALRIDALNESACRTVMEAAAMAGEIGTALRCYATLYDTMSDELDMEPSDSTQAMVANIKRGLIGPAAPGTILSTGTSTASRFLPMSSIPVLAVLPLRLLGPDLPPVGFAEAVVEDLVGSLASVREPVVISANSTRHLTNPSLSLSEVRSRLGVQYVVSGSLRRAGVAMQLHIELTATDNEVVLWGSNYDVIQPSNFDQHGAIATRIVATLVPQLRRAELRQVQRKAVTSLTAYELLMRAREDMLAMTRESLLSAEALLTRAIAVDPEYQAVQLAMANCLSLRVGLRLSDNVQRDTARLQSIIQSAVSADPYNGAALAMFGHSKAIHSQQFDAAITLIEQATMQSPNDAEAMLWGVPTLAYTEHADAAIQRGERALALSPEDPFRFRYEHFLSAANYMAGQYESAISWGEKCQERNSNYLSNLCMTAAAYSAAGHQAPARALGRTILQLDPTFRVRERIAHFPFRARETRIIYADHLINSGLPE